MSTGEATAIFLNCFKNVDADKYINPGLYPNERIARAVYEVAHMDTHNGIDKESMVNALRWILDNWVVEESDGQVFVYEA